MIYQSVLDKTPNTPTENMSNEAWLEKRRTFIGGSDAGAVMGLSHYGSPLTVYLEKRGMAQIEENEAMLRGSIMEPYIRQLTRNEFPNMEIEDSPFIFQSKERPFMGANVDGFIYIDEKQQEELPFPPDHFTNKCLRLGIHEIKTSQDGYGFSEDEIPDAYYAQVQHYMAVLFLPWAILTVYIISKNKIRHYPIMRDDNFVCRMIDVEKDFYNNYLVPGVMPSAIGIESEDDMITGLFEGSVSTLALTEEEMRLCRNIHELKEQIKPLEEQEKAAKIDLKAKLIARAKPNETEKKLSAIGGPFSVSWSTFETRRVDTDALRKAGLYDQYCKSLMTDRLTVSAKKGA
jgi:putative phage-type endonuclease